MTRRLVCRLLLGSVAIAAVATAGVLTAGERDGPGARHWGPSRPASANAHQAYGQPPRPSPHDARPVIRFQNGYFDPNNPVPAPRPIAPPATGAFPNSGFAQPPGTFPAPPGGAPPQPFSLPEPDTLPDGLGGSPSGDLGPTLDGAPLVPPGGLLQAPDDDPRVILIPTVQETQTGRFSIGAGINSDAGILGNIVLDEQNFDITRFPRRFGDLLFGNAFRGAGQHFRIEAVPGDELQRYTLTFNEPYLAGTPVSFGLSAFYFTRFFEDWREQRTGGNVSFGYQVRPDLSMRVALRAEEVRLRNPRVPTPPEVAAAVGNTDIYSVRFSMLRDTRDSAFLPTEGHMYELSYEQAFGEFDYPRLSVDARQYFLARERPDRSGRHVISLRGRLGITGKNTPVFEHFFAGGYSTLRGFDFRGAVPVVMGTAVGGDFMALGSVEYLLPITADDGLRMVFFCDFGTVEERVEFDADTFRVAPGFGFRISVPQMGPAPIAVDFAWAANKADFDDTRVFSFFIGLLR